MAFTYDPSVVPPSNITLVRFHIADNVDSADQPAILDDDEITMAVSQTGSVEHGVIWCIQYILGKINNSPDFIADKLEIDQDSARTHWGKLLDEKRKEFGILPSAVALNSVVVTTVVPARSDTL